MNVRLFSLSIFVNLSRNIDYTVIMITAIPNGVPIGVCF